MTSYNLLAAAASILISSSVIADIRVTDTHNGAWITVTENGTPAANATVTVANVPQQQKSYKTNDKGRVFIPITLENARSIKYEATTENGKKSSRYAFNSSNRN